MISEITARHVLARHPDILSTEAGGEVAIMSLLKGNYYLLNAVASDIWRRLERPVEAGQLATSVVTGYTGDPERIESDLRRLLEQLLAHGLIEATFPTESGSASPTPDTR